MQKIKNLIRLALSYIYFPFLVPVSKNKIKKTTQYVHDINEAVNWVNNFRIGPKIRSLNIHFKPAQVDEEIKSLLKILEKSPPRIIVEIGTATGGTLFLFTKIASPDAKIISIDLPFGKFGAGYLKTHIPLFKSFAQKKQQIFLLRENSQNKKTLEKLQNILNGELIDFLFIDGDHTYQGVASDFKMYKSLVKPGGIIALHDIKKDLYDSSVEVDIFWQEIKNQYQFEEFIANNQHQSGCGIGIIYNK